ncbi:MAG: DUF4105 domain-containing protein [Bacteroidales bacterium]|nr:DUF4105 domain-containing protein [Bacteroidales bacterium]
MLFTNNIRVFTRVVYKCLLVIISLLCVFTSVNAQVIKLSKQSRISLLTCSSGDELYSVFGHSALRVVDDSLNIDVVFNYGTFDFNTPNFYLKFMNGDLDYMLSTNLYRQFIAAYKRDNRSVTESILDLSDTQKEQLWEYLVWNISPDNRFYRYDFFFDNCATRIRDIVFKAKGIDRNLDNNRSTNGWTYRDYIHYYVPESSWTAQGIDLLLGMKTDDLADAYNRAYLPVYLDSLFVNNNTISKQQLVIEKEFTTLESSSFTISPDLLGWSILIISILIFLIEYRYTTYIKSFDVVLFLSCALLSLLFWYLWLFTKHSVCSLNINVLWASILYWPIIVLLLRNKISIKLTRILTSANIVFLALFILLSVIGVQDIPSMSIPIAIALTIRNGNLLKRSVVK